MKATSPAIFIKHRSPILSIDETIEKAVNVMVNRQVGSVLVKDKKGQLAGIFTERDLLNNFLKLFKADVAQEKLCVPS